MVLKEVDYQIRAVNELYNKTEQLLNNGEDMSLLIFKAPTGSGKTIMTANYIQKLCNYLEEDLCFVWVSVGKGELHVQSKKKLEKIFEGFPKVSLLSEEFFGYRKEIDRNEVVVVNWESINNKDSEGNYTNVLMRDGEKTNFRQVLDNTRTIGRKIILIIDESHYGATTERANELREEIKASIILEMSATPKFKITPDELDKIGYVKVKPEEVINAEMIKKQILVNEGISDIDEANIDKKLLELVFNKRNELKELYELEESNVNPLVIIQLPNAEEGDNKKDKVIEFFKEKGITKENGKLAIWLNEEKINLDSIPENTDKVEFLIFKQAIDTGWDCPRSQILLKFRESKSTIFEKQTLGRILRMPEQKHYVDDNLNRAYVYTDFTGNILKVIDPEFDFPEDNIRPLPIIKKETCENIELYAENILKRKKAIAERLARNVFKEMIESFGLENGKYDANKEILKNKGFEFETTKLTEDIISGLEINTKDLLSNKEDYQGSEEHITYDEERIEISFRRILRKHSSALGNSRDVMFDILRNNIYQFFFNYVINFVESENFIIDIQRLFVLNYNYKGNQFFQKLIIDVINRYKDLKEGDLKEIKVYANHRYHIPVKINVNPETYEKVDVPKYFYDKCYLEKDRSNPERAFEVFIVNNLSKIDWWVKNGDNGTEYFSLAYDLEGYKKEFYPDYIIKFLDGRIGLFEAKDKNDDSSKTTAKAERLYQYILTENSKGKNLLGGIVANYGTHETPYIKINRKEKYTINNGDWEDLQTIL
jgi:type III restriction enzyme